MAKRNRSVIDVMESFVAGCAPLNDAEVARVRALSGKAFDAEFGPTASPWRGATVGCVRLPGEGFSGMSRLVAIDPALLRAPRRKARKGDVNVPDLTVALDEAWTTLHDALNDSLTVEDMRDKIQSAIESVCDAMCTIEE